MQEFPTLFTHAVNSCLHRIKSEMPSVPHHIRRMINVETSGFAVMQLDVVYGGISIVLMLT